MLFLAGHKFSVDAVDNVIYVPDDYSTIQEAINYANSGDTIFVREGTYFEHVVINKSVSLIGESTYSTVIDGSGVGSVVRVIVGNVNISGFTVRGSGSQLYDSGIVVDHCNNVNISSNIITENQYGISLHSCSKIVISNNIIYSNTGYGIILYYSSENFIHHNTVMDNYDGACFYASAKNILSSNNISSNDNYGISLYYSTNNRIFANNVILNDDYGIYLTLYSSKNTIYHNNFINNTSQVWSDSVNSWENGNEGNYWSDYEGKDLNADGIGDTPYIIGNVNRDNYPLMGMFFDFGITLEGETYHITAICNSTISNFIFEIGKETGNRIIHFDVAGSTSVVVFCRIAVPTQLMSYPYIVLVGNEEITPTLLDLSNETHVYLYFTCIGSCTTTIISSRITYLYNELLNEYAKLKSDFQSLNSSYWDFLNNYTALLRDYNELIVNYSSLSINYTLLLSSYNQIQQLYYELNSSYQELLSRYHENELNAQNLTYVIAALSGIIIVTIVYLSKSMHTGKIKAFRSESS